MQGPSALVAFAAMGFRNKRPMLIAIGGLLAMAAGVGVGRFVYTPILPPMVEALSLSKSQAGLIASANFVGYLAGALLAAMRLAGSRRAWLLGSLAVNTVCLAAMGLTTSMPAFLALRLMAGIVSAFILVLSSALVLERLASSGKSALSAVHFAGVGIGIAVSAALVPMFAEWRMMWFAGAVVTAIAGIAVAFLIDPDPAPIEVARETTPRTISGKFATLLAAYGLFGFGYVITATFIVAITRGSGAIASLEPYIWLLFGLSAAPSVALWTRLGARWGPLQAFAIASVLEAIGVAAGAVWITPFGIIVSSLLVGGTFMGLTALGFVAARQSGRGDPRGRLALMTASFGVGQILGPLFAGYVYDHMGGFTVPLLAASLALLAAGVLAVTSSMIVRSPA
jgi:predicted MFS family arabinose efflux permease